MYLLILDLEIKFASRLNYGFVAIVSPMPVASGVLMRKFRNSQANLLTPRGETSHDERRDFSRREEKLLIARGQTPHGERRHFSHLSGRGASMTGA